jgi:hypothetical protein
VVANAASVLDVEVVASRPGARLRLVTEALRIAGARLTGEGRFLPFGLALTAQHEIVYVLPLATGEAPGVEDLIALLRAGLEAGRRARRYVATTLALESEIPLQSGLTDIRAIELRLCDEWTASTLCFPHVRERGELRLEWPHWRGEVTSAERGGSGAP